jgi:hypothetical protein
VRFLFAVAITGHLLPDVRARRIGPRLIHRTKPITLTQRDTSKILIFFSLRLGSPFATL